MFLKAVCILIGLLEDNLNIAKDLLVDTDYLQTAADVEELLVVLYWFPVFITYLKGKVYGRPCFLSRMQ